MLNKVILIGRLTKDPELKYTPAGAAVTTFTLACDRPTTFKLARDRPFSSNGEKEADFINIVSWKQLAENCANYLRKGKLAAVEGRLQVRSYKNSEGKNVYVTEVIADNVRFLEKSGANQTETKNDPFAGQGKEIDVPDDLPF